MSMHIDHASRFSALAQRHGLILPRHLPTQPGLAHSEQYRAVFDSSQRTRSIAERLRRGVTVSGQRVDAAGRKREEVEADALGRAHVLEWAQTLAYRAGGNARLDAFVGMANEALTGTMSEVYRMARPELSAWSERILPIERNFPGPADDRYEWAEVDLIGVARAANTYSTQDIPLVAGGEMALNYGTILPALVGMETNFMDGRREAAARSNRRWSIDSARLKAEACEQALAEFANFLWLYGDPMLGIYGFHNHPSVSSVFINKPWTDITKTAAEIAADLVTIINAIPNATRGEMSDFKRIRILLPPRAAQMAQNLIVSAAGDKSVLKYFTDNNGLRPEQIEIVYDFAAANSQIYQGGPNGLARDRGAVIYEKGDRWDPRFLLPQDIEMPAPPRQNGLSETTFYHMRVGGMLLQDARRMLYIEGL